MGLTSSSRAIVNLGTGKISLEVSRQRLILAR